VYISVRCRHRAQESVGKYADCPRMRQRRGDRTATVRSQKSCRMTMRWAGLRQVDGDEQGRPCSGHRVNKMRRGSMSQGSCRRSVPVSRTSTETARRGRSAFSVMLADSTHQPVPADDHDRSRPQVTRLLDRDRKSPFLASPPAYGLNPGAPDHGRCVRSIFCQSRWFMCNAGSGNPTARSAAQARCAGEHRPPRSWGRTLPS
jgi:hypothetical protein